MAGTSNNLRKLRHASKHYNNNITKRGLDEVKMKKKDVEETTSAPPYVLYFIIFVLVSSSVVQLIASMRSSPF